VNHAEPKENNMLDLNKSSSFSKESGELSEEKSESVLSQKSSSLPSFIVAIDKKDLPLKKQINEHLIEETKEQILEPKALSQSNKLCS
jgi:hypothetical protein